MVKPGAMERPLFAKIVIAGLGLMGGSLGLAVRQRGLATTVVGLARRRATCQQAKALGAVDQAGLSVSHAVSEADLIVLAGPVSSTVPWLARMQPYLAPGCLVTDVGSTKAELIKSVATLQNRKKSAPRDWVFIGSHPMAGSEKSGVTAARPDLYTDCHCLIVPPARTPQVAVQRLSAFWTAVGCRRVSRVSAEEHDRWTAVVSHVPHALAVCLVNVFGEAQKKDRRIAEVAATGFRDTTRIAAGSVDMWLDILLSNRAHVGRVLRRFKEQLAVIEKCLAQGSAEGLRQELEKAKTTRDRLGLQRHWTERT